MAAPTHLLFFLAALSRFCLFPHYTVRLAQVCSAFKQCTPSEFIV